MKTYVNTSLIDAHNAQMQLEQLKEFAYVEPVPWRSMESCLSAQRYPTLMVGFGIMMWLMMPPAVAPADEYINTYEISEVNIKGNASDSVFFWQWFALDFDSLSEIQNNLSNVDTETSESAVTSGDEDGVADIDEQTCRTINLSYFANTLLRMEKVMSIRGLSTARTTSVSHFNNIVTADPVG